MSISLSQRMASINESATLKLNSLVQQMKKDGVDVVNLTAGEPDFFAPEEAKEAVIQALKQNKSKYTPVPGIAELRKAVAEKTNAQQRGMNWKESNVIISNGGKQALFNFFMVLLEEGDEVIIPSPYWLSYPDMVKIFGGKPVVVRTALENDFKMSPEQLEAAITSRTKAVVFNSPSNPAGSMYSQDDFVALAKVIEKHPHIAVISDEIYDRIILDKVAFSSFLDAAPQLKDRTVTVNGMSKSGAMTGWRIGWAVAPEAWVKSMSTLQGQSTSGVNALAQAASVAALAMPESAFFSQVEAYRKRRDLLLGILSKCGKIKVMPPKGAFYAFVGLDDCLKKGEDAIAFSEALLQEAKVAVVPGNPFGEPTYVRLSFATDERSIQEGCERFVKFIEGRKS